MVKSIAYSSDFFSEKQSIPEQIIPGFEMNERRHLFN